MKAWLFIRYSYTWPTTRESKSHGTESNHRPRDNSRATITVPRSTNWATVSMKYVTCDGDLAWQTILKKKTPRMGVEPTTFRFEVWRAIHCATEAHTKIEWRIGVSIPVPRACKARTLPIELIPLTIQISCTCACSTKKWNAWNVWRFKACSATHWTSSGHTWQKAPDPVRSPKLSCHGPT